tara:strand:- start:157 stop:609 length:453 start_codon:yes stop_codon:yes gene_type:complete
MIKNKSYPRSTRKGLNDLISLYEINYIKLMNLLPIQEKKEKINFLLAEGISNSEIRIYIERQSRYTSKLILLKSNLVRYSKDTEMEILIYHDLRMAEVRKFNGQRQFWLRNKYPNKYMSSKDEKFQWNIFFSEFLTHSKKYGLSSLENMH